MLIRHKIYNFIDYSYRILYKFDFIFIPAAVILVYLYSLYFKAWITINQSFITNLISICAVLCGFLLTSHTMIMGFPEEKKFIVLLKEYGIYKKVFIEITMAEILLGACLIVSIFDINNNIASILFVSGFSYTVLVYKALITISFYISK